MSHASRALSWDVKTMGTRGKLPGISRRILLCQAFLKNSLNFIKCTDFNKSTNE